ncbi:Hypothetical predicted protein [Cloeon dipterum]|uniref:HIT-type domain-containing protein n=2 Tax=Cloeon dipterum TaxID=197152 RepID=A0A8S1DR90_9INSE|nr:Hypothetical predicted protein [Cloeon dipterum]
MSSSSDNLCILCGAVQGKYVCPRCNVYYCSLDCYRSAKHANCSEQFYKECIQEEMAVDAPNPDDAKSVQQILTRLQEADQLGVDGGFLEDGEDDGEESEGDSDDLASESEDLAARLAGIDLNNPELVWQKLSEEEKAEFQSIIASGDAGQIVPAWEPWWMHRQPLVQEVTDSDDYKKKCPQISTKIPLLKDIAKVNPGVKYGISNAVMAYVIVARHFQGDHLEPDLVSEAADCLMDLSLSLGKGENFADGDSAVTSVKMQATEILESAQDDLDLALDDFSKIMEGPSTDEVSYYLLCALSDCINVLSKATKKGNGKSSNGEFSKRFLPSGRESKWTKKQLMVTIKKLEFYAAWVKSCS